MPIISESEASALLAEPLRCMNAGDWRPVPGRHRQCSTGAGLMDDHGRRTELFVDLRFHQNPACNERNYLFSVLKRNRYGTDRVYQLAVRQAPKPPKDVHKRPHEHWGSSRIPGHDDWVNWNFDELLRHFCSRTNITFQPQPEDPAGKCWSKQ